MKTTMMGWVLLAAGWVSGALADDTPSPPPKGDFMSSLKQSFRHDYDHDVIRGHFDIGTPPDAHRYYCLIDPSSGKLEANGVAGSPIKRPDGMTGIQGAAVSFYSCADAESKGLLLTGDYRAPAVVAHAASPPPKATSGNTAAQAPEPAPAASTTVAPAAGVDAQSKFNTSDPLFTLQSFIQLYNSGDVTGLESVLVASADFAWVQPDGQTLWGYKAAAESLRTLRAAGSQLQFQSQEGHAITLTSRTTILISRLRLTSTGQGPQTLRCSSVLVPSPQGWRIVSLFMTPESG